MNTDSAKPRRSSSFIIPEAQQLEPYQQGHLDGLCGLYAVINAIRIASLPYRPDRRIRNEELFIAGLRKIAKLGSLADFVAYGLDRHQFRGLTSHLCRTASTPTLRIKSYRHPIQIPAQDRKQNIINSISAGQPVLLDMEHRYHYSVAVGYSAHTLTLFDSYGYCRTQTQDDRTRRSIAIAAIPLLQK